MKVTATPTVSAPLRAELEAITEAAAQVLATWQTGNLAGAVNALDSCVRSARAVLASNPAPDTAAISEALDVLTNWSISGDDVDRATRHVLRRARAQLRALTR